MSGRKGSLTGTIRVLTLFFSTLSLLTFIPATKIYFWPLEVNANFKGYYFFWHLFALFALPFCASQIRYFKATYLLQLFFLIWIARDAYPFYFTSIDKPSIAEESIGLLYANINSANPQKKLLGDLINEKNPEIVALVEVNKAWIEELNLKERYLYHYENPRRGNFGLAVYSKLEIIGEPSTDFGEGVMPAFDGVLKTGGGLQLRFVLLHAAPPVANQLIKINLLLLRRLSTGLRFEKRPVVVAGDFNAGPFSPLYQKFIEWTNLSHAFHGRGLYKSWNAEIPFLIFTLDHILYKGVRAVEAEVLPHFGSDHFPLYSRINLPLSSDRNERDQ